MKRVAALVAITLLTLAGLLAAVPLAAPADAASAPSQAPAPEGPLRLDLAELTPRVVTAGGPRDLTVAGTLTNTGNEPISDLVIRIQRGNPIATAGALRDALDGTAAADAVTPQFTSIPGELAPGAQVPVRLIVPLRGAPTNSLALATTGVHELLVNVNGERDGARARLAAARMLLPALSLPPDPESPEAVPDATTGGAQPFALLYPVTDRPHRVATVPGEPTLLTDDELATSFAPGGRLGGLVDALVTAAPTGSRVRQATCLAIDPDLVETASLMSRPEGYQVLGPDGTPVPGTGGAAAARWLDQLRSAASGGCVIALPYADADLVALTRGGMGPLADAAISEGRRVLADVLQVTPVNNVTWPAEGAIDDATLDVVGQADGRSLLLSADSVEQRGTQRNAGVVSIAGGRQPQFAVLTDPLLTRAGTGPSELAPDTVRGAAVPSATAAGSVTPLSTQDLIGALTFRTEARAGQTGPGVGPLVLAPPHQWAADGTGAAALLNAVDMLLNAGRIVPRPLDSLLATGPPTGSPALPANYPLQVGGREIPPGVVATLRTTAAQIDDLASTAVADSGVGVSPEEAFAPLRLGLVRPASAAWRTRSDAAETAARQVADRVAALRATVRVLEPPSPFSLASSDAPILITVANGLPVTIRVTVEILPSSGLRVAPIEPQEVPPLGRRQLRVSAEVTRSGQFNVLAAVRSPQGELLGPPSRLQVRSTVYGTITVWLTASAGILLVVLAGRRVIRRIRGEPARRGGTAPAATPVPPSQVPPPPVPPDQPGRRGPPQGTQHGDPFPDPLAATDRLPVTPPGHGGPRRPPGPPRVTSQ